MFYGTVHSSAVLFGRRLLTCIRSDLLMCPVPCKSKCSNAFLKFSRRRKIACNNPRRKIQPVLEISVRFQGINLSVVFIIQESWRVRTFDLLAAVHPSMTQSAHRLASSLYPFDLSNEWSAACVSGVCCVDCVYDGLLMLILQLLMLLHLLHRGGEEIPVVQLFVDGVEQLQQLRLHPNHPLRSDHLFHNNGKKFNKPSRSSTTTTRSTQSLNTNGKSNDFT